MTKTCPTCNGHGFKDKRCLTCRVPSLDTYAEWLKNLPEYEPQWLVRKLKGFNHVD